MRVLLDNRVGMKAVMHCGLEVECIAYRSHKDCDFKFETGEIVEHRYWKQFVDKSVAPSGTRRAHLVNMTKSRQEQLKTDLIGKVYKTDYGYTYEVIEYIDSINVKIRYNDGYETTVASRYLGKLKKRRDLTIFEVDGVKRVVKIGEKIMQKCGLEAELISIRSDGSRVDVMLSNGVRRNARLYKEFVHGDIGTSTHRTIKIGDTFTLANGEKIKVVVKNGRKVTVEFKSGFRRTYMADVVKDGANFEETKRLPIDETFKNKWFITKNGLKCRFLSRGSKMNLANIEYEDGQIKNDVVISSLKRGDVGHPMLKYRKGMSSFYEFKVKKHFTFGENVYFGVYDDNNELLSINTLQELYKISKIWQKQNN